MTKGYPLAAITKQVNWIEHKYLHGYLQKHGIAPVQSITSGGKTWRIYDHAAYTKACELRRQRDAELNRAQQSSKPVTKSDPTLHQLHADVRALHDKVDLLLKELGAVPSFNAPYTNGHAQEAQQ